MKYPCEECLVDVLCMYICDAFIFFSDHLYSSYIPKFVVKTDLRYWRVRHYIIRYGGEPSRGSRLWTAVVRARQEVEDRDERSM